MLPAILWACRFRASTTDHRGGGSCAAFLPSSTCWCVPPLSTVTPWQGRCARGPPCCSSRRSRRSTCSIGGPSTARSTSAIAMRWTSSRTPARRCLADRGDDDPRARRSARTVDRLVVAPTAARLRPRVVELYFHASRHPHLGSVVAGPRRARARRDQGPVAELARHGGALWR